MALPPVLRIASAVRVACSSLTSSTATEAPAAANSSAVALPIPRPAPVTMAAFPGSSNTFMR
jgi:hypothetical protein